MMTQPVLPSWIDQVRGIDFTPEKELLSDLERWADEHGWEVSDGSSLPSELRQRTDVLIAQPARDRYLRIAVLRKSRSGRGCVRIDATAHEPFTHRIFELMYEAKPKQRWRVETASVPLIDDIQKEGWQSLVEGFAFR